MNFALSVILLGLGYLTLQYFGGWALLCYIGLIFWIKNSGNRRL